jgi:hypothetical protein
MEMGMQSPMISSVDSHRSGMGFSRFLLKTGLVLFLTVDICIGFLYLLYSRNFRWVELIPICLAVFAGLTAGILSRVFFRNTAKLWRWVIAGLVVILTLALAGVVIQEWIRVDLTGIWLVKEKADFAILSGIGWLTAMLAIFAWQAKPNPASANSPVLEEPYSNFQYSETPVTISPKTQAKPGKKSKTRKRSVSIIPAGISNGFLRKNSLKRWLKRTKINISRTFGAIGRQENKPVGLFNNRVSNSQRNNSLFSNRSLPQTLQPRSNTPVLSPTPLPRRRAGRKMKNPIRLVGREELRCPYCLQVIDRKDPHGVIVCPICKSAHHKECWDITGSCQVPHNHAVL